jgi:hypothetical protein
MGVGARTALAVAGILGSTGCRAGVGARAALAAAGILGSTGCRAGVGARAALAAAGILGLTGCSSGSGGGTSLGDMILSAGVTPAPIQAAASRDTYCPAVSVMEGGSAIQVYAGGRVGDAEALRSQVALGQIARECALQPDGSVVVKVGVEGRALQGAGGGGGRFDVPIRVIVKNGPTVLANRATRTSVAIPAGDTQGSFAIVEDGLVVPASASQEFEIEVGLGGAPAAARRRRG